MLLRSARITSCKVGKVITVPLKLHSSSKAATKSGRNYYHAPHWDICKLQSCHGATVPVHLCTRDRRLSKRTPSYDIIGRLSEIIQADFTWRGNACLETFS